MAGLTPFAKRLGTEQVRIDPKGWPTNPEGSFVLCIGHDAPDDIEEFGDRDFASLGQTAALGHTVLYRFKARIRSPKTIPSDVTWEWGQTLNDAAPLVQGKERNLVDQGGNLTELLPTILLEGQALGLISFWLQIKLTGADPRATEFPAFYIDDVEFIFGAEITSRPILLNRNPEPNETDIPESTTVLIEIANFKTFGGSESAAETYSLADSQTLLVEVDGGGAQTITFLLADFLDITAATAEEVAIVISAQITGAEASVDLASGKITIRTLTQGTSGSVQITGGTANPALGFSTSLFSGTADGIDEANTQVFINGTLAFDGGVFQTGFTGPTSSAADVGNGMSYRIRIDPTSDFTSEQVVTVRVVSQTDSTSDTIDESYSFTVEDLTAPQIFSAVGRELARVRVTYDEPVKQTDPTETDDALNPDNYTLSALTTPAVSVVATSVEIVDASTVDVLTDIDLSPGQTYNLKILNVVDTSGNPIPNDDAQFEAFTPDRPAGRVFDLFQFMPVINRQEDDAGTGDLRKFLSVLQEPLDLILGDIDRFSDILDPDIAPEPFVDAILFDLGNPFSFDIDLADKRRLIRVLVDIYRQKGTGPGIINAVRFFLGLEVTINSLITEGLILGESELDTEWILAASGAGIYTFEILILEADSPLTDEQRTRIREIADLMKPAHTHFNIVEFSLPVPPLAGLGDAVLLPGDVDAWTLV
jgi:phage tail-like protein